MAKGSALLKTCSILMIIGACFSLFGFLLILVGLTALGAGFFAAIALVFMFVGLCSGLVQLVAGILGLKNWNRPEKAQLCLILGVITTVLSAANVIYSITGAQDTLTAILLSLLAGVVVPVLYSIGAFQLGKLR